MSYIVYKTVRGRKYAYLQRSYREGGKVKTRSVYIGSSAVGPGSYEVWFEKAKADALKSNIDADRSRLLYAADIREKMYKLGHPSPKARAASEQLRRKGAAEKELKEAKDAKPTVADEADLANRIDRFDNWIAERQDELKDSE